MDDWLLMDVDVDVDDLGDLDGVGLSVSVSVSVIGIRDCADLGGGVTVTGFSQPAPQCSTTPPRYHIHMSTYNSCHIHIITAWHAVTLVCRHERTRCT